MKTGTSWIHEYLDAHAQASVPTTLKETFYFTTSYEKGEDWYFSNFAERSEGMRVGEVAPTCFRFPESADRISDLNGQCKIVVTLREPIDRLVSHYLHARRAGVFDPQTSFREALAFENIAEHARYFHHVSTWTQTFGRDNVAVLLYEQLRDEPQEFVDGLCRHLEIDLMEIPEALTARVGDRRVPVNRALAKASMGVKDFLRRVGLHGVVNTAKRMGAKDLVFTKQRLEFEPDPDDVAYAFDMLIEDIQMLESSLGFDLTVWRKAWARRGLTEPVSG